MIYLNKKKDQSQNLNQEQLILINNPIRKLKNIDIFSISNRKVTSLALLKLKAEPQMFHKLIITLIIILSNIEKIQTKKRYKERD